MIKIRIYLVFFLIFFSIVLHSQIILNEAFIKGNNVEVGVNSFGIFGTDNDAPLDYHARLTDSSRNLGFVADPDQDGWATGTPNYYGDFFYPGAEQEGFSVQFNNSVYHNWNSGSRQIPGNNISITDVGTNKVSVWNGGINGLNVKQTTIVPQNQVFFVVRVELTNTTAAVMNNVYYLRTLDPDNEVTLSGSYDTKNDIVFTLPNTNNNTLVSASGLSYTNCYLGLGSKDCRAKPFIINSSLYPNSSELIEVIHNRTNTSDYQYTGTLTDDVGIGISFFIGNIAPGQIKRLAFTYILKQSDLEVALSQTLPEVTLNSAPILQNSNFNICENQAINLSVQNGQEYTWHWEPEAYFATPYGETNVLTISDTSVDFTVTGQSDCSPFSLNFRILPSTFESPLSEQNHVICTGNLTSYNPQIGLVNPISAIRWYDAQVGGVLLSSSPLFNTPVLTNPSIVPAVYTYYYEETNSNGCVSKRVPFRVTVYNNLDLPNNELKKCVVGSITTNFNLNDFIDNTFDNPTYVFYASLLDLTNNVPIINPSNYTNTINNQVVYVKVSVNAICLDVVELTLRVFEQFVLVPQTFLGCDDDSDQKMIFDLTSKNTSITSLPGTSYNYFLTNLNAQNNVNSIVDFTNYTNITNPQVIYVRASNSNCHEITTLTLNVFKKTIVSPTTITNCKENINGSANFNLSENNNLISSETGLTFSYYTSLDNLNNNLSVVNSSKYENVSNPQTIFVKILNANNCFSTTQLTLNVQPVSQFTITDEFKCDDSNDGFVAFDLNVKIPEILTVLPTDTYTHTYHLSEADALMGVNGVSQNYTNTISPQTVFVRSKGLNNCPSIFSFNLIVLVKTVIIIDKTRIICENSEIILDAGSGFDDYEWSTLDKTQSIVVTEPGNYTITVSNKYGARFCETTEVINVVKSNIAQIENVVINDWSVDQNSLTIFVTGLGDYEYSIDNINYQDSPNFSGLEQGILVVYVRDKNGCGLSNKEVYILNYPKYFTPNGDGYNDFWNVKLSQLEPDLKVSIFDRAGKLLKTFTAIEKGWDGNYINSPLPATDYWFVVNRKDGKEFKGHFSLKR